MKVKFISRSPGTGHSLEMLFKSVADEYNKHSLINSTFITLPYISKNLYKVWRNLLFVWKQRTELVHITGDVHYVALAIKSHKTVLTIADCVLLNRTSKTSIRFYVFWLLWYYWPIRKSGIVTAISCKTKQELYQYVGKLANKVVVIPCSYAPVFHYHAKSFNTDKPLLLQIGTAPHKNLHRLVEAIAGLPCQLIIVGKITDSEISHLANHNIDYCSYAGINQEEIVRLYGQCDMVMFVSLYEGFGVPILEAQAVGRPVITSNRSPMIEVGGEGACYVDPTDVGAIREGVLRVWHDSAYRTNLIRHGLKNVQSYTVESVAAQYAELYARLK